MADLLTGLGPGQRLAPDAGDLDPEGDERHAGSQAGRAAARVGAPDGAAAAAPGASAWRPPRRLPTRRTIATHVAALVALGARVISESGYELAHADGCAGPRIYLDEASVTGTETALLAAAGAQGATEIRHSRNRSPTSSSCASSPARGSCHRRRGPSTIRIEGRCHPQGATHRLHGDYTRRGAGRSSPRSPAAPPSPLRPAVDMEPITAVLQRMKLNGELESDGFAVHESRVQAIIRLTTACGPGSRATW